MHHQLLLGVHLVVVVGDRAPVIPSPPEIENLFNSQSIYPSPGFRPMNMSLTNKRYFYLLELFRVI